MQRIINLENENIHLYLVSLTALIFLNLENENIHQYLVSLTALIFLSNNFCFKYSIDEMLLFFLFVFEKIMAFSNKMDRLLL